MLTTVVAGGHQRQKSSYHSTIKTIRKVVYGDNRTCIFYSTSFLEYAGHHKLNLFYD